MNWEGIISKPGDIERESFAIIARELEGKDLLAEQAPVVMRVIHTTADFDYADSLYFSPGAVGKAQEAVKGGADIVCDTNMIRAGINKKAVERLGCRLHCFMAEEAVAREAERRGITRAAVSMERAVGLPSGRPLVVAVGNAPTALISLNHLIKEGTLAPDLVVAVPVGFVNVVESKELFLDGPVPAIVARGRKGGSTVAAAICNALLYLAGGR